MQLDEEAEQLLGGRGLGNELELEESSVFGTGVDEQPTRSAPCTDQRRRLLAVPLSLFLCFVLAASGWPANARNWQGRQTDEEAVRRMWSPFPHKADLAANPVEPSFLPWQCAGRSFSDIADIECGYPGISRMECEARGCCFTSDIEGNFCFPTRRLFPGFKEAVENCSWGERSVVSDSSALETSGKAKADCLLKGPSLCKAVTCANGMCEVRGSISDGVVNAFVPSASCFQIASNLGSGPQTDTPARRRDGGDKTTRSSQTDATRSTPSPVIEVPVIITAHITHGPSATIHTTRTRTTTLRLTTSTTPLVIITAYTTHEPTTTIHTTRTRTTTLRSTTHKALVPVVPIAFLHTTTTQEQQAVSTLTTTLPEAPVQEYYMYRAVAMGSEDKYPFGDVNVGNIDGVIWYLQNEVVTWYTNGTRCPRKFNIARIKRYKVLTKATKVLFNEGMHMGVRFAYDKGKCMGRCFPNNLCSSHDDCTFHYRKYGFFPGCNSFAANYPFPAKNTPAPDGVWYSLPLEGRCNAPTGAHDCTWSYEDAGEISLASLEGTTPATDPKQGNCCEGTCTGFWDDIFDTAKTKWRSQKVMDLFQSAYPTWPRSLDPIPCDFDWHKWYEVDAWEHVDPWA